jgi:predicted oxidoreductase
MHLGGSWEDEPLRASAITHTQDCVQAALEGGITFFDHADIYCLGKSEEAFGHIWSELGIHRDSVTLQSKCGIRRAGDPTPASPHRFDFSYDHITTSIRRSLERLKTEYIDIFLLHRADPLMDPDEVARAFMDMRNEGLVWQFGVSNFNSYQIDLLQSRLPEPLVANQIEFNLLHSGLIDEGVSFNNTEQRTAYLGDGTLEYCRRNDIMIQAYSPIARGVITPAAQDADARHASVAATVSSMAKEKNASPEAILVAWILRHPAGIRPIIGTTRPERIRFISKAREITLTRDEWYTLYLAGRGNDIP